MNPQPTATTFAAWFLVALAVGIGWALGNWLVVMLARILTTGRIA